MKFNKLSLLPLLLTPLFLSGCDNNKVQLDFGQYQNDKVIEINYGNLASLVKDESNFLIAVYPASPCNCWPTFENNVLEPLIFKYHLMIYKISYNEFFDNDNEKDTYKITICDDRETFAIFKDGALYDQTIYSDKAHWRDLSKFEKYLLPQVILPTMFYISQKQLETIYKEKDLKFSVLFGFNKCPDCTYAYRTIFKDYHHSHKDMKPLLMTDMDDLDAFPGLRVRALDENGKPTWDLTEDAQKKYDNFLSEYGLPDMEGDHNKYGYLTGKVPSIYRVKADGVSHKGDIVESGITIFNDEIEKIDEKKFIVKTSFFSEEREKDLTYLSKLKKNEHKVLQGMILDKDDVQDASKYGKGYIWWHHICEKYYRPLVNAFFDESLPQTSDNLLSILDSTVNTAD